jgi:hypothetical protein
MKRPNPDRPALISLIYTANYYQRMDDLLVARVRITTLASFAILQAPIPLLDRSFFPLGGMIQW